MLILVVELVAILYCMYVVRKWWFERKYSTVPRRAWEVHVCDGHGLAWEPEEPEDAALHAAVVG